MILLFAAGFLTGTLFLLLLAIAFLFNVFGKRQAKEQTPIPASKTRIPPELKAFLRTALNGNDFEWESCTSISLLLHCLFQEYKDTRQFKRWLYKKLQLELNDVTARNSTAGRIIQAIQIRDLESGANSPILRNIRVESFKLANDDPDLIEELVLLLDLEYKGGFQMSVDALMAFGKFAQLSVKLLHLCGKARLTIRRQPFAHWAFSFVEQPQMELKIDSQFQGRNLRHLIPLIGSAFRKVLQLKHVWPNYKIRFRPLFQNPLLNPSPNFAALEHIKLTGTGLEITVLSSSRLNMPIGAGAEKLFCKVFIAKHPYGSYCTPTKGEKTAVNSHESSHTVSILLAFSRKGPHEKLGLTFSLKGDKDVCVEQVELGSNAEKSGFQVGDLLVAVNNITVRNERQASRLLSGTAGDLLVLVERELNGNPERDSVTPLSDNFESLDNSPMEYRARDETEDEFPMERFDQDTADAVQSRKGEEPESLEMMPLKTAFKPNLLHDNPRRPIISSTSTTILCPRTPTDERKNSLPIETNYRPNKENNIAKNMIRKSSLKENKEISRIRKLRRSRSESSLIQVKQENEEEKSAEALNDIFADEGPEKGSISTGGDESISAAVETDREKHGSKRERLHAKANEMAKHWQAGRNRFNEFLRKRKPAELAVEVNDDETMQEMGSPTASTSKEIVHSQNYLEKPKGKTQKKDKSPSPAPGANLEKRDAIKVKPIFQASSDSKCTKSVPITKNPIWGQSLHFTLRPESLYLSVLVCAEGVDGSEILFGYTNIYVPRIVDDCMLTLSNCHRERFHLRMPRESEHLLPSELEELSKHNGFDQRLCFGDVVLGFRFFPDGLPEQLKEADESTMESGGAVGQQQDQTQSVASNQTPSPTTSLQHNWVHLQPKQYFHFSCGICNGKIWLKGGSRCEHCNFVCHNNSKCITRAKTQECHPTHCQQSFNFNDDAPFEELNTDELCGSSAEPESANGTDKRKSATEEQILTQATEDPTKRSCRRRRFAEKLQTISAQVKHGYSGYSRMRRPKGVEGSHIADSESPESPTSRVYDDITATGTKPLISVSEVLDPQFLSHLEGFSNELNFNELRFEPGNAYNPTVICEAKTKGQNVFANFGPSERKAKINSQIDRVQSMIEKVTRERRSLPDKNGEIFDQVDNRLQALALVMLLYCSGLSDCVDKEEQAQKACPEKKPAKKGNDF